MEQEQNTEKAYYLLHSYYLADGSREYLFIFRHQCFYNENGFELDAIAACFVGGTSPYGGIGKVTGSIVGAVFMMSLTNGMNLMGIDISYQYMVRGLVLLAAVIFDVTTRNRGK